MRAPSILLLVTALLTALPVAAVPSNALGLRADLKDMEYRVHRDPSGVLQDLQISLPTFERADRDTRLWYLLRRAQAHNALFMHDAFEQDIAEAQALLLTGATSELTLWIQSYAGMIEVRRGELRRGVEILADVAERALNEGAGRVYVFTVQELAYTRGLLERYESSLLDLQKAFAAATEIRDPGLLAMVTDSYAAVYGDLGEFERAERLFQQSLAEFKRLGYKEYTAHSLEGLASTYRQSGQWELAEEYYEKYLEATAYARGEQHKFYGNYGLAMTLAQSGQCARALPMIAKALGYKGPDDYDAELHKQQARCEIRLGRLEQAEASLNKARAIFDSIPELAGTSWVVVLLYIESQLQLAAGNPVRGYELLEEFHRQELQSVERSSSDRIAMLRTELEADRKDEAIAMLEDQAEVYELRLRYYIRENEIQRIMISVSAGVSLLIMLGLYFQWRSNRRILRLSFRDGLSGLYNRSYTFDYLEKIIPRITVNSGGLSVILLDVDNFKLVNDMYGHPAGDDVIKRIAQIGEESLRTQDVMGRIGGEEFLCILPRTTLPQCQQVAERLLEAITRETFAAHDGREFSVSISVGVVEYDKSVSNADDLYSRADQALYEAKASGKGRVSAYRSPPPVAAAAATGACS